MLTAAWSHTDLTPTVGFPLCGFAREGGRFAGSVRDPILARCLILADADQAVVLVTVDWCGIRRVTLAQLRAAVAATWPLDLPVTVHVVCSHTHSGPDSLFLFGCQPDDAYFRDACSAIATDVATAARDLAPVALAYAQTDLPLNHNRRAPGQEGRLAMRFEPGVTTGVTDPTLAILELSRADGRRFLLWHYTAHPVTLNGSSTCLSADYPAEVRRRLEAAQPDRCVAFANGAAANIHLHDCIYEDDRALVGMGAKLADAVAALCSDLTTLPVERLQQRRRELTFPNRMDPTLTVQVELNHLQLGALHLPLVPGEYFVEFQIDWRSTLPGPGMLIGYANGWPGYIPPRAAYPIGGYGVDIATQDPPALSRTCVPEGGGEAILDALRELAADCNA